MNHPLVSIALCTYNGKKHLPRQLDSILHQTHPFLEIIISDDASTDGTIALLEEYQKKDARIKILKNENNTGYIKNFEKTIQACSGKFIAPSDQDDVWKLNKIELLLQSIGDNILIYHDSEFVNENLEPIHKKVSDIRRFYRGGDSRHLLFENCVSGHACLFKSELREIIFPFPDVQYHDWWIALASCGVSSIDYVNEPLAFYRQHAYSHTDILAIKEEKTNKNKISFERRQNLLNAAVFRGNKQYAFCKKLAALHQASAQKFLSFKLFYLVVTNRKILFYCRKKSATSIFFECIKFLWGLKLKKFFG